MADYKLIPESVPGAGARGGVYSDMLASFVAMKEATVRVEYGRKANVVYAGLKNALRKNPEFKGISVARRGEAVYLVKKK
jgi:hypothetical protein